MEFAKLDTNNSYPKTKNFFEKLKNYFGNKR